MSSPALRLPIRKIRPTFALRKPQPHEPYRQPPQVDPAIQSQPRAGRSGRAVSDRSGHRTTVGQPDGRSAGRAAAGGGIVWRGRLHDLLVLGHRSVARPDAADRRSLCAAENPHHRRTAAKRAGTLLAGRSAAIRRSVDAGRPAGIHGTIAGGGAAGRSLLPLPGMEHHSLYGLPLFQAIPGRSRKYAHRHGRRADRQRNQHRIQLFADIRQRRISGTRSRRGGTLHADFTDLYAAVHAGLLPVEPVGAPLFRLLFPYRPNVEKHPPTCCRSDCPFRCRSCWK